MVDLPREFLKELSPFELDLYLEKEILTNPQQPWLNAGRGNPNWMAPAPRAAFFLLGQFIAEWAEKHDPTALTSSKFSSPHGLLPQLTSFLARQQGAGADFLSNLIAHSNPTWLTYSTEQWWYELLDAITGDNYPNPVGCLPCCADPLKAYLTHEIYHDEPLKFDVFATEGGTAGICYMFDSLVQNYLLNPGDHIAIMLPTFAPYLELPELPAYHFNVLTLHAKQLTADQQSYYEYSADELKQLEDPAIKAVLIVNPNNPTANTLTTTNIQQLTHILKVHPTLMILSDDVYGTFIPDFKSLFAYFPYNTLSVYSFSKFFGATGWRLGCISVAQHNIFDDTLHQLPPLKQDLLATRYQSVAGDNRHYPFINRLVADSRDVALHHAGGLSTPQQAMMALFSLYSLSSFGRRYRLEVQTICRQREHLVFDLLGLPLPKRQLDSAYYCDLDLLAWLAQHYSVSFAQKLTEKWQLTDLLVALAQHEHIMFLKTDAFGSSSWAIRLSLANLSTDDYRELANRLLHFFDNHYQQFLHGTF